MTTTSNNQTRAQRQVDAIKSELESAASHGSPAARELANYLLNVLAATP